MPRLGLLKLVEKLKADPQQTDIKREVAEMLGPGVFYVRENRFEPAEEREEVVGEVEEVVAEDGLEPVGEVEEVEEDGEYLGQRVVRRAFPDPERLHGFLKACLRPLRPRRRLG
jgi:hypothetical protein